MGEELSYTCEKCGKVHRISWGAFFMSPQKAEDVLAGSMGRQARLNMERHPGKSAMFWYGVFGCRCGYVRSKRLMAIYDDDQVPWSMDPDRKVVWHNARCRCPKCGRSMRERAEPPTRLRCTCGAWTGGADLSLMFD